MNLQTYNEIKNRIKYNIKLNNGYQLDDLVQETCLKLIEKHKTENECVKMCITTARNILIDYYRKHNLVNNFTVEQQTRQPEIKERIKINTHGKSAHYR